MPEAARLLWLLLLLLQMPPVLLSHTPICPRVFDAWVKALGRFLALWKKVAVLGSVLSLPPFSVLVAAAAAAAAAAAV